MKAEPMTRASGFIRRKSLKKPFVFKLLAWALSFTPNPTALAAALNVRKASPF
jgi:hypothetical protein